MAEPSDAELWRSVEVTVRDVLLPSITDDWARVAAVNLLGVVRLAATRPPDPTAARVAELVGVLGAMSGNAVVAAHWPTPTPTGESESADPAAVMTAVSAILADAVTRPDAAGDEVRTRLRPVVSRHLDDDLSVTGPLTPYFRGQIPDA